MSGWAEQDLRRIGDTSVLRFSVRRADGTLRPAVPIWVVRAGDGLFVRSSYGPSSGWYRRVLVSGRARVQAGRTERDVLVVPADAADHEAVDESYIRKYDERDPRVVGPGAHPLTLRLLPDDTPPGVNG